MTEPANDVIDISVECDMERNRMAVTLTFERDFDGILYTKGFFKIDECRHTAPPSRFQRFDISLDKCGMQQKSSTDNFGGTSSFANTVVVMNELEWGVLEMWDKAYRVTCDFGGDRANTVDYGLQVPNLDTENVAGLMAMPSCRMKVVSGDNPMLPGTNDLFLGDIATLVIYIQESSKYIACS
ncbi:PREDICTED: uncharacterized protein LOC106820022 [Priapulus caudatus]|uniref:Uncharacterized protein LOC106820022 n=1 Tax=Priapulus caudatus TaxID=37621 RepID=A0ABM1F6J4_PRICU|nr:PREDICTED: uncharacterized protein LOC106820022 [Priapulus caudatus]